MTLSSDKTDQPSDPVNRSSRGFYLLVAEVSFVMLLLFGLKLLEWRSARFRRWKFDPREHPLFLDVLVLLAAVGTLSPIFWQLGTGRAVYPPRECFESGDAYSGNLKPIDPDNGSGLAPVFLSNIPFFFLALFDIVLRYKFNAFGGWTLFCFLETLVPFLALNIQSNTAATLYLSRGYLDSSLPPIFIFASILSWFACVFALRAAIIWKFSLVGLALISMLPAQLVNSNMLAMITAMVLSVLAGVPIVVFIARDVIKQRRFLETLDDKPLRYRFGWRYISTFVLGRVFLLIAFILGAIRAAKIEKDIVVVCVPDIPIVTLLVLCMGAYFRVALYHMDTVVVRQMQSLSSLKEALPKIVQTAGDGYDVEEMPPLREADLQEGKLLGRGAYGAVYSCYVLHGPRRGSKFAVKKLLMRGMSLATRTKLMESLEREIDLLQTLDHARIVTYIGAITAPDRIWLIMNLFDASLQRTVADFKAKSEQEAAEMGPSGLDWIDPDDVCMWTEQITDGLRYLHANCVAHNDLKPDNILVQMIGYSEVQSLSICDLGISRRYTISPGDDTSSLQPVELLGTEGFAAPEAFGLDNLGAYDPFKADMYGLGAILFFVLTGVKPAFTSKVSMDSEEKPSARSGRVMLDTFASSDYANDNSGGPERILASTTALRELGEGLVRRYGTSAKRVLANSSNSSDQLLQQVYSICCRCLDQDPTARPSADAIYAELSQTRR